MHEQSDTARGQRIAHVVVDIPARELGTHFDYVVPQTIESVVIGSCVLVDFANRPAVGYVLELADSTRHERIKPIKALLAGPYFGAQGATVARWIAEEYAAPLSAAVRLFTPPGGNPSTCEGRRFGWGELDAAASRRRPCRRPLGRTHTGR